MSGVATLSAGGVLSQGLTAIAALVVARRGGDAQFGRLAVLLGFTALVCDLADFGTSSFVSREVSSHRIAPRLGAFWALRKSLVAVVAGSVLTLVAWRFEGGALLSGAMGAYVIGFCTRNGLLGVCRAAGHYLASSVAPTVERSLLVVIVVVCAVLRVNVVLGFVVGLAFGALVSASIGLGVVLRSEPVPAGWTDELPMSLKDLYGQSRHLGLAGMASDLNVLEVPVIGLTAGLVVAGNYSAATRLAGPLEIPANSVASILAREVSASRDQAHPIENALRHYSWVPVCYLLGCSLIALASSPIVHLLYGPAFGATTAHALTIAVMVIFIRSLNDTIYASLVGVRAELISARWLWATIPLGVVLAGVGAHFGGAALATLGGGIAQLVLLYGQTRALVRRRTQGRRVVSLFQAQTRLLVDRAYQRLLADRRKTQGSCIHLASGAPSEPVDAGSLVPAPRPSGPTERR